MQQSLKPMVLVEPLLIESEMLAMINDENVKCQVGTVCDPLGSVDPDPIPF